MSDDERRDPPAGEGEETNGRSNTPAADRPAVDRPIVGRRGRTAQGDTPTSRSPSPTAGGTALHAGASRAPRSAGPLRRLVEALVALTLTAIVAAAAFATWAATQLRPVDPTAGATVEFEVEPGWGAARVAQELEEAGLIRNASVFSGWLQLQDLDRAVGAGLYDLSPAASARATAEALAAGGRPRTVQLVVPEGWRASELAARLQALDVADADAVLDLVASPGGLAPPWLPDGAGLEGYLFPDTYELRADATAKDALAVAIEHFEDQATEPRLARVGEAGLSVHAWVTLASMVQAEADGPEEMGIIAGVFLNRLDRGMLLQSDPTVAYGLGKRLPELSAVAGDLDVDHAWNTYTRGGLPAGPIGNPGRDALDAVLAPERTRDDGDPWLYFLHGSDEDGRPVFRPNVDLASHNRDVERFLR